MAMPATGGSIAHIFYPTTKKENEQMNLYTYILKAVSACIALFTLCNIAIDYIIEYIFITIICGCIAVILWLVADILDEMNSQKTPSHRDKININDTTERLQKGA